ncbi:unnamed protein product [Amoebophrya sp. A25]|nr:unnamed protein product [Amoebophrya sp. A25]|eukprot:GSA25T00023120001.1
MMTSRADKMLTSSEFCAEWFSPDYDSIRFSAKKPSSRKTFHDVCVRYGPSFWKLLQYYENNTGCDVPDKEREGILPDGARRVSSHEINVSRVLGDTDAKAASGLARVDSVASVDVFATPDEVGKHHSRTSLLSRGEPPLTGDIRNSNTPAALTSCPKNATACSSSTSDVQLGVDSSSTSSSDGSTIIEEQLSLLRQAVFLDQTVRNLEPLWSSTDGPLTFFEDASSTCGSSAKRAPTTSTPKDISRPSRKCGPAPASLPYAVLKRRADAVAYSLIKRVFGFLRDGKESGKESFGACDATTSTIFLLEQEEEHQTKSLKVLVERLWTRVHSVYEPCFWSLVARHQRSSEGFALAKEILNRFLKCAPSGSVVKEESQSLTHTLSDGAVNVERTETRACPTTASTSKDALGGREDFGILTAFLEKTVETEKEIEAEAYVTYALTQASVRRWCRDEDLNGTGEEDGKMEGGDLEEDVDENPIHQDSPEQDDQNTKKTKSGRKHLHLLPSRDGADSTPVMNQAVESVAEKEKAKVENASIPRIGSSAPVNPETQALMRRFTPLRFLDPKCIESVKKELEELTLEHDDLQVGVQPTEERSCTRTMLEALFAPRFSSAEDVRGLKQHPLVCALRSSLRRAPFAKNVLLNKEAGIVLSLSGGVDSIVHAALLAVLRDELVGSVCALHLRHANRAEQREEESWVGALAENRLGLPLYCFTVSLQRPHGELKTGLSRERYEAATKDIRFRMYQQCFRKMNVAEANASVMIGHHQDDVDENRIAELLKGSLVHINGVSEWLDLSVENHGAPSQPLNATATSHDPTTPKTSDIRFRPSTSTFTLSLYRPLLECRKDEFFAFAHAEKLCYMRDSTPLWSRRGCIRQVLDWAIASSNSRQADRDNSCTPIVSTTDGSGTSKKGLPSSSSTDHDICNTSEISEKIQKQIRASASSSTSSSNTTVSEIQNDLKKLGDLSTALGDEMDVAVRSWKETGVFEIGYSQGQQQRQPEDGNFTSSSARSRHFVLNVGILKELAAQFEDRLSELVVQIDRFRQVWNPLLEAYASTVNADVRSALQPIPATSDINKGTSTTKTKKQLNIAGPFLFTRAVYAAQSATGKLRLHAPSPGSSTSSSSSGAAPSSESEQRQSQIMLGKRSLHHSWQACERARVAHVQNGNLHRQVAYRYLPSEQLLIVKAGSENELDDFFALDIKESFDLSTICRQPHPSTSAAEGIVYTSESAEGIVACSEACSGKNAVAVRTPDHAGSNYTLVETPRTVRCKRFEQGRCTFGSTCKFLHAEDTKERLRAKLETSPALKHQCRFVIHGQRRCKNAALVGGSGLCSRHTGALKMSPSTSVGEKTQTSVAASMKNDANQTSNKSTRISASCRRMQNPESIRDLPAPLPLASSNRESSMKTSILLDIGCARGRWLLDLHRSLVAVQEGQSPIEPSDSSASPTTFPTSLSLVGLELRPDLVEQANEEASSGACLVQKQKQEDLGHLQPPVFRSMNCKNEAHWDALLELDGEGQETTDIQFACIQFPDPWAKKRHLRRRLVDSEFAELLLRRMGILQERDDGCASSSLAETESAHVSAVVERIRQACPEVVANESNYNDDNINNTLPGTRSKYLYLSSDREDLLLEMTEVFAKVLTTTENGVWQWRQIRVQAHPFGIGTERDLVCEHLHREVFRMLFVFSHREEGGGP